MSTTPWQWIIDLFVNKFGDKHLPVIDFDNDTFSTFPTFRGYNWRGKDCNDLNKEIYPGRKTWHGKEDVDYNCNGIYGTDPIKKKAYK